MQLVLFTAHLTFLTVFGLGGSVAGSGAVRGVIGAPVQNRLCSWKAWILSSSVYRILPSWVVRSCTVLWFPKGFLASLMIYQGSFLLCSFKNFSQCSLFFFLIILFRMVFFLL